MLKGFISKKGILVGGLLLGLILRRCYYRYWNPNLIVTFFDVGQGDSALIQFPFGKTMLIDGGGGWGNWSLGERVLIPELSRLGILKLDHVVLSHPDSDHAFGLIAILKQLKVGEFWLSKNFFVQPKPSLLTQVEKISEARQVRTQKLLQQNQLQINGVAVTLIPLSTKIHSRNNEALVVEVDFGKCRILFVGDIERDGEKELIKKLSKKVHLLKVPHHGSLTSSTFSFLKHYSPKWALVSVGLQNSYGHPKKEILSRYRALGIQLFRTDFHGAVRFTMTPKGQLSCETYLGDCGQGSCD